MGRTKPEIKKKRLTFAALNDFVNEAKLTEETIVNQIESELDKKVYSIQHDCDYEPFFSEIESLMENHCLDGKDVKKFTCTVFRENGNLKLLVEPFISLHEFIIKEKLRIMHEHGGYGWNYEKLKYFRSKDYNAKIEKLIFDHAITRWNEEHSDLPLRWYGITTMKTIAFNE